jgi:hypothetical protein
MLTKVQTARSDFTDKIAKAAIGGPPDTANKNNSRQALLSLVRQLAGYVQIQAHNDMATLLSSGFLRHEHQSRARAARTAHRPTGREHQSTGEKEEHVQRPHQRTDGRLNYADGINRRLTAHPL